MINFLQNLILDAVSYLSISRYENCTSSKFSFRYVFLLCFSLLYVAESFASTPNYYISRDVNESSRIENAVQKQNDSQVFSLFTHGRPGALLIDGKWLNASQIAAFLKGRINVTHQGISQLNIYGCEFGKGSEGEAAVAYLQSKLGIPVAASDDITGRDGDWILEVGEGVSRSLDIAQYNFNLQVLYKPALSELSSTDQENYPLYANTLSSIINANIVSLSSTNGTSNAMLWSDNSSSLGNPNIPNYDPIHNDLTITPTTPLNDLSGIALWAPSVTPATGDGPVKNFTVTITYSGGTWISGMYTTVQPTALYVPDYGQEFSFGQEFDGVTKITINTYDGWYKVNNTTYTSALQKAIDAGDDVTAYNGNPSGTALNGYNISLSELRLIQASPPTCAENPSAQDICDGISVNPTGPLATSDCDGDGVTNAQECADGTDPTNPCDYNSISITLAQSGAWLSTDCDGDGVTNGQEVTDSTDPFDPCDYIATSITLPITTTVNCDYDGDGILNSKDLDNDNDGILDTDECPSTTYTLYTYNRAYTGWSSNVPVTIVGQTTTTTSYAQNNLSANLSYNGVNWDELATGLIPDANGVLTVTIGPGATNATYLVADAMLLYDGTNYYVVDNGDVGYSVISGNWINQSLGYQSDNQYTSNVTTASASWTFNGLEIPFNCDIDGDGIPNYLDLDSDNDGCPDAIEGDENVKYANLNSNGSIAGSVDSTGVPILVNSTGSADVGGDQGQGIGAAYDSSVVVCCDAAISGYPDYDGDGVADQCDLDKDNDGILDINEGCTNTQILGDGHRPTEILPVIMLMYSNNTTPSPWLNDSTKADNNYNMVKIVNTPSSDISYLSSGSGLTIAYNSGGHSMTVSGINTSSLSSAMDSNDYVKFQFKTKSNLYDAYIDYVGFFNRLQQTGFTATYLISDDNFTTYTNLATFVEATNDGTESSSLPEKGRENEDISNYYLEANKTYSVRIYFYSVDSGTTIDFDDIYLAYDACNVDTDGDGIPDYLDLDSDGDGCPDAIEGSGTYYTSDLVNSSLDGGNTGSSYTGTSGPISLNLGTTVDQYGVPDSNSNGTGDPQGVGSSQNSLINGCNTTNAEDDINQTTAGVPTSGNVLTNDSDAQGDNQTLTSINGIAVSGSTTITLSGVDESGNPVANAGSLTINPDGSYTFTPTAGFTGTVTVSYTVTDDNVDPATDGANLVIDVTGDNGSGQYPPLVVDDNATTEQGNPVTINILSNDSDPDGTIDPTTVSLQSSSIPGSTCTSTDAQGDCIEVTVPGEGTYTVDSTTGVVTFTPDSGFVGTATPIGYTVSDNDGNTDAATISVSVIPVDATTNVMTVEDDANSGMQDETLTGNVLTNDIDPDGSSGTPTVTASMVPSGTNGALEPLVIGTATTLYDASNNPIGELTLNANGTYTWNPEPDFVGTISVPYTACDNNTSSTGNACDNATLYLTTAAPYNPIKISGYIYIDRSLDGLVNGIQYGPQNTYALLIDEVSGKVIDIYQVDAGFGTSTSGYFEMDGYTNKDYKVILYSPSPTSPLPEIGQNAPATSRSAPNIVNVSDAVGLGTLQQGSPDGISTVFRSTGSDIVHVDFGVSKAINIVYP